MSKRAEVVVVGAGIAGLCAAYELTGGAEPLGDESPLVTVIDAADEVGGKLGATMIDGRRIDTGPDGSLARRPEVIELCEDLGLADQLLPIAASGASVYARGHLRELPPDLQLGIPTSWRSLRKSRALSRAGLARAALDVIAPRPSSRGKLNDRAIGGLVERKLGREVVSTFVDPMIGGISAGRVAEMSAAAVFPQLLEAAQQRGGLMAALRAQMAPSVPGPEAPADAEETERPRAAPAAAFVTLAGGMHSLPLALRRTLESRQVRFHTGVEVTALRRQRADEARWAVESASTTTRADAVVLATPTTATARLIDELDHEAASLLAQIDYASVAVVTFSFDDAAIELPAHGTGVLVPPETPHPSGTTVGDRFFTTALSFLDRKWPHLATPGTVLLRSSLGRVDDPRIGMLRDDEVVAVALDELRLLLGDVGEPREATLTRWVDALPQYRVNHLLRVGGIESGIARLPGIAICGAAYQGVGVPACVGSGRRAGRAILDEVRTKR